MIKNEQDKKVYPHLYEKLSNIFSRGIFNLSIDPERRTLSFTYGENEVSYERLLALACLLGTDKINFTGKQEEHRYSEVTIDTTVSGKIYAENVQLSKENV